MARKIKFALEMADGAKVRGSIEELREHFDIEKAVGYFLSGKLTEWLEDRYYEDESEKLDAIDKDAPDFRAQLCKVLGVEYEDDEALDAEQLARLNEKKAVLRQKTSDETIITNADKTALTQEDLADLLDMDEPMIYLCGDSFNIPARVKSKKYIGILGTPAITIKAKSQEELDAKGIVFENVKLPWGEAEVKKDSTQACPKCGAKNPATAKFCNSCGASMDGTVGAPSAPSVAEKAEADANKAEQKKMMDELFVNTYGRNRPTWLFVNYGSGDSQARSGITASTKQLCVKLLCRNQYTPDDIVHVCMENDSSVGWALTYDSFCTGGAMGDHIIKYSDIKSVDSNNSDAITISTAEGSLSLKVDKSNVLIYASYLEIFLKNAIKIAKLFEKDNPKPETQKQNEQSSSEQAWRFPKEQLKALFAATFKENFESYKVDPNSTFLMVTKLDWNSSEATSDLTELQKSSALALLCGGQYTEDDLIHLRVSDDMSYGWAFTRDSFCIVSGNHGEIVPYESLSNTIRASNGFFDEYDYPILDKEGLFPSNASTISERIGFYDMGWREAQGPLQKFLFNMKNMFRKR